MNYQPSEVADLILMLALGPVIIVLLRRAMDTVPTGAYVAIGAMFGAYFCTVAEGFVLPDLCNLIEHACYAAAGVAFVVTLVQLVRIMPSTAKHPR